MAEYRRVKEGLCEFNDHTHTEMSQPKKSEPERPPAPPTISQLSAVPTKEMYEDKKKAINILEKIRKTDAKKNRNSQVPNGKVHQETRGRSEVTRKKSYKFYKNELKPKTQVQSQQPTIIRSGYSYEKKKKPPPRPPPPKCNRFINSNSTISPPSYEDVVNADIDAFLGEMSAPQPTPQVPIRPRPPVPRQSRASSMPHLAPPNLSAQRPPKPLPRLHSQPDSSSTVLIDFDAPLSLAPVNSSTSQTPSQKSFLDLDEIFSCNEFPVFSDGVSPNQSSHSSSADKWKSQVSATKLNLGPRLLPPGPVPSLQHRNSNPTATRQNLSCLQNGTDKVNSREDWLLSCLKNTINGETSASKSDTLSSAICLNRSFEQSASDGRCSPTPLLPPRPPTNDMLASNSALSDSNVFKHYQSPTASPEPPSSLPPPVPPLPRSESTSVNIETELPPLPPRPKQLEARPHAIALYDYTASQSDELSFKASEIITLIHYVNCEWLLGSTDEAEGIFPKNFIRIMVPLPGHEEDSTQTVGPYCLALYDFEGENDQELTFSAGDIIALESKENDEWLRGSLNGKIGMFPACYVEIFEDVCTKDVVVKPSFSTSNDFIALYNFRGEDGELTFKEGQKIIATQHINEEWMMGKLENGAEGRFPKTYVIKFN